MTRGHQTAPVADPVVAELRRLAVAVEALLARMAPPALPPQQQALLDALAAVFGGAPFSSAEVIELARVPVGARPLLRAALAGLGLAEAHAVGLALADLARRTKGAGVRVEKVGAEAGSRLWCVVGG